MMKVIGGDFRINEKVAVRKGVFHQKVQKIFMPDGFVKLKGYKPEEVRSVEMKNQAGKLVNLEVTFTDGRRALLSGKAKDAEDFLTLQYNIQRQQEEVERTEATTEPISTAGPRSEQPAQVSDAKPESSLFKRLVKVLVWAFVILFVVPLVLVVVGGVIVALLQDGETTSAEANRVVTEKPSEQKEDKPKPVVVKSSRACGAGGIAVNGQMAGTAAGSYIYTAPSKTSEKVKNKKLSKILGKTEYYKVSGYSTYERFCIKGDWTQLKNGWVPNSALREIAYDADGKRIFVEDDVYWDKYTRPYKAIVVRGVNKVSRENSRCRSIDTGSAAKSTSKGTAQNPVFFVGCKDKGGNPFNAFFSKSDVESDKPLVAVKHVNRGEAILACEQAAKERAQNPQTVDFSTVLDLQILETPNGRTRVSSTFTAKNLMGIEGKFNISCLMDGAGLFEVSMAEAR